MGFDLGRPLFLALLLLLPLLGLLEPRGRSADRGRLTRARLIRGAVLVLLCLALARLEGLGEVDGLCVTLAVDMSDSVGAVAREEALRRLGGVARDHLGPMDRLAVVTFGREAKVLRPAGPVRGLGALERTVDGSASDLGGGVDLAVATFPEGISRRILLVTDGVETAGDLRASVRAAARQGIAVDVLPCGGALRRDLRVEGLVVPDRVREGEPYEVRAVLRADFDGLARVSLRCNGRLLARRELSLRRDERRVVAFPQRSPGRGHFSYSVLVESPDEDGTAENNEAEAFVRAEGRPRILVIRAEGEEGRKGLPELLEGSGLEVEQLGPGGLPARAMDLAAYAAVCLDDCPASAVDPRQMETLAAWVREGGGGLAMFGGERSFGAGGWHGTPVAEVLPVSMEVRRDRHTPDVGVVAVIDKSGSMAYTERGRQKIDLANEGSCKILELLKGRDHLGVLACDTCPKWVLPFAAVGGGGEAMARRIRTLRAGGGGIYAHVALSEAIRVLRASPLKIRHVILFSDTADTEQSVSPTGEHVFDLAAAAARDEITVSTVGIGRPMDKDLGLLRGIAHHGKGRFYFTADMFSIPQIFAQEAMLSLRKVVIRERFAPRLGAPSPLVRGLEVLPDLHGYVATTARPAVTVALWSHRDDPLLAHGRCGLGRSLAFTSDLAGPWTRDWAMRPSFAGTMRQAVRWLAGPGEEPFFTVRTRFDDDGLHVVADAVSDEGEFLNFVRAGVRDLGPDGAVHEAPLRQKGPGRYEALLPTTKTGVHLLRIARVDGEKILGTQIHGAVRPYSDEYRGRGPDPDFLRSVAADGGGRVLGDDPIEAFRRPARPERRRREFWDLLVLLALVLWLVDVAHRRLAWKALLEAWRGRRRRGRDGGDDEGGDGLGRLRSAKASLALRRLPIEDDGSATPSPVDTVSPAGRVREAAGAEPSVVESSVAGSSVAGSSVVEPAAAEASRRSGPSGEGTGRKDAGSDGGYTSRLLRAKKALRENREGEDPPR